MSLSGVGRCATRSAPPCLAFFLFFPLFKSRFWGSNLCPCACTVSGLPGGAPSVRYSDQGLDHGDQGQLRLLLLNSRKPAGSLVLSNRNVSAASYLLVQAASGNLAATVFWEGPRVAFSIIWVVPPGTDVKKSFRIFWSHFHFYIIRMDEDRRSPRVINHGLAVHSFNLSTQPQL